MEHCTCVTFDENGQADPSEPVQTQFGKGGQALACSQCGLALERRDHDGTPLEQGPLPRQVAAVEVKAAPEEPGPRPEPALTNLGFMSAPEMAAEPGSLQQEQEPPKE